MVQLAHKKVLCSPGIVTANCDEDNLGVLLGNGDGTFAAGVIYKIDASSSCPIFVSVSDFNNDGVFDLMSANYNSATMGIFLGSGDGTFQESTTISTGDYYVSWFIFKDLNNDKQQDIVFVAPDSSVIGVLLTYANGSFGDVTVYSTDDGSAPMSLVVNDFNKDNIPDIIAVNSQYPTITILFGNGNGSFVEQDPIVLEDILYSLSIVTGDFNNDGEMDLVTTNAGSDDITVLLLHYQADFGTEITALLESGAHPSSVTMADFDNDNQMDIIVANSGLDNVQILIGYANRTFKDIITHEIDINSHPRYAIAADFNKDKQLDIAVVNSYIDTLVILLFSENKTVLGTFDYSTGIKSSPNMIGLGDFNKDNWVDIVVVNNNTNNIGVFLGYAYPTFNTSNIVAPKRGSSPYYIVVADFNKDSHYDIAVAYRQMNSVGILLGNGNGTFNAPLLNQLGSTSEPTVLAIGDFNKDNNLDIVTVDSNRGFISILFGYGNGSFEEYKIYATGSTPPSFVAVGDFNNDTIPDIVITNEKSNNVGIFIGYGNGSFADQILYKMVNGSAPVWVVVADFNKDNVSDIAITNRDGNNIHILSGFINGTFKNVAIYSTGNNSGPCSTATGDFNKDNLIDIAVANRYTKNIQIFVGHSNGTFSLQATYFTGIASALTSITVADVNNDTRLDIILSDWGAGHGNIGVLYGLKNGTFLLRNDYSVGFNSQPTSIAVGDFNNDGRLDFAVSNSAKNNIGIKIQNLIEPFGTATTYSTGNGSRPCSVAVMDLNNDGQVDIAVTNFLLNNIGIFLGNRDGSFAEQKTYSTGNNSGPIFVTIADLNNDKQMDIIVANFKTDSIGILYGDGKGIFRNIKTYSTGYGSQPNSVSVAPFTSANDMNIIVTLGGTNTLLVFNGYGNETFSSPVPFLFDFDSRPVSTAIGDLNNDTVLDIALANYGLGYIDVLLLTCV